MKNKFILITLTLTIFCLFCACGQKASTDNNKQEINIALDWSANTNHTGLYVAQQLGFFDEEGLKVNIEQPYEDGSTVLVSAGSADFGIDFQDYLAPAFDKEQPITIVAALLQHNTSGFLTLKAGNINSVKDFENKTYATVNLPVETAVMKYIMNSNGSSYSDINKVYSTVTDAYTALNSNINILWSFYCQDDIACRLKGLETNFIYLKDIDSEFDYYTPVLIANNNFTANNPDATKAFLRALKKGYEYAAVNPDESAQILITASNQPDATFTLESQRAVSKEYISDSSHWGIIDKERFNRFYKWLYDNGVTENDLALKECFTNEFLS